MIQQDLDEFTVQFRSVQKECKAIAENNGFDNWCKPAGAIIANGISNLHGEVSEAWEAWRDNEPMQWDTQNGKPVGFVSELADVVIRAMDLAEDLDLDLAGAIVSKMKYNETRPWRHGGKRV